MHSTRVRDPQTFGGIESSVPPLIERKQLSEYMADRVRMVAAGLKADEREIPFLLQQLQSPDFVDRYGAVWAISRINLPESKKDAITDRIKALKTDSSTLVRDITGRTLREPVENGGVNVFQRIISQVDTSGKVAELEATALDTTQPYPQRCEALSELTKHGKTSIPSFERILFTGEATDFRNQAMLRLAEVGDDAIPTFERLITMPAYQTGVAKSVLISALGKIGEAARPLLDRIASTIRAPRHTRNREFEALTEALSNTPSFRRQMSDRIMGVEEPALATPYMLQNLQTMEEITAVVDEFSRRYGNNFTGVFVRGSTGKGYMRGESDIDVTVITEDQRIAREFAEELYKKTGTRVEQHSTSRESIVSGQGYRLFSEMFIGELGEREKLRREYLNSADEQDWESTRRIAFESGFFSKLQLFGFTNDEKTEVANVRAILYTPPTLQEMIRV